MNIPAFPFSPETFTAPLAFKTPENGGIGDRHPGLAQAYRLEPVVDGQKRLHGRAVVTPQLDLGRYRVDAVVDWVIVCVESTTDQPPINVKNWIEEATGAACYTSGPGGQKRCFGRAFEVTVQDPTPKGLGAFIAAVNRHPRLSATRRIAGLEVSVDWYAYSWAEDETLLMADLLWRHLLPPEEIWRCNRGWPRFFRGKAGGDLARPEDTEKLLLPPTGEMRESSFTYLGVEMKNEPELRRDLARACHVQPVVDGTVYFGPRQGPRQIRVMYKVKDQQNRGEGTFRKLRKRERRARIEVTLTGEALEEIGLNTLDDLRGFSFQTLRQPYFAFWRPTFPWHGGKVERLEHLLHAVRGPEEIEIFKRTGVFGLEVYQRAWRRRSTKARRKLINLGAPKRKYQRAGRGERGYRVAFDGLNDRAHDALRRLTGEWGG